MSQLLIDKLKKSRETNVGTGGYTFTVRRPTDMEAMYLRGSGLKQGDLMEKFVVGWSGVTELDIIPGGTGLEVPFETRLFMEWVADKPNLWADLVDAIVSSYKAHEEAIQTALGKPDAG
ncbi:MAG: hypothetical protein ACXV7F_09995 [Methylomonas sp.]